VENSGRHAAIFSCSRENSRTRERALRSLLHPRIPKPDLGSFDARLPASPRSKKARSIYPLILDEGAVSFLLSGYPFRTVPRKEGPPWTWPAPRRSRSSLSPFSSLSLALCPPPPSRPSLSRSRAPLTGSSRELAGETEKRRNRERETDRQREREREREGERERREEREGGRGREREEGRERGGGERRSRKGAGEAGRKAGEGGAGGLERTRSPFTLLLHGAARSFRFFSRALSLSLPPRRYTSA